MDANEAQVWNTAIAAVAAIGGTVFGAGVTFLQERVRRRREDRYRFADQKRVAYFDLITELRRFLGILTDVAASMQETRNLGTELEKEKAAPASAASTARRADLVSRAEAGKARDVENAARAKAITQELERTIDMVDLLAPGDVRLALQKILPAAQAMAPVIIGDPGHFADSPAFRAFKSAQEALVAVCHAELGADGR